MRIKILKCLKILINQHKLLCCFLLLCIIQNSSTKAQQLELYQTDTLEFYSKSTQSTFKLDISLPESFGASADEVKYPLIILFDSYNTFTHTHNLHTIDMLTFHGQMPEAVVVGVPFTMQNRLYLTSWTYQEGENKAGIEKMAQFIFNELIPLMKEKYKAGSPVLLLGHSRTAYLVSYFMTQYHQSFQLAGAFSGFMEQKFQLQDLSTFLKALKESGKTFHYYYSAGSQSKEEAVYLKDFLEIKAYLETTTPPSQLRATFFENPYTGHMANYNLSVPKVLNDYFGKYAQILGDWLFAKLDTLKPHEVLKVLKNDFEQVATHYQGKISPSLLHIFSIANYYAGKDDNETALAIYQYGRTFYPKEYELAYYTFETAIAKGEKSKISREIRQVIEWIKKDSKIDKADKQTWIADFEALLE